jgi:hypothetical protein
MQPQLVAPAEQLGQYMPHVSSLGNFKFELTELKFVSVYWSEMWELSRLALYGQATTQPWRMVGSEAASNRVSNR